MGLLNQQVAIVIRLLARWESDAMCCYLHIHAHTRLWCYAALMLSGARNVLQKSELLLRGVRIHAATSLVYRVFMR